MDLGWAYHKRADLADALVRKVQRIKKAEAQPRRERRSVSSTGRSERQWRVADRLSEVDVRQLVETSQGGTPKWKLAELYGISESSVKRLVRKHRAAQDASA